MEKRDRKKAITDAAQALGWSVERIDLRKNTALLRRGNQSALALLWRGISETEAIAQVHLAVGHQPAVTRRSRQPAHLPGMRTGARQH